MIIPPERFRDEELFITKEELETNNHTITISSEVSRKPKITSNT